MSIFPRCQSDIIKIIDTEKYCLLKLIHIFLIQEIFHI